MAELARVLRNFQITLPKKLRRKFHLKQGGFVRLDEWREGILIRPLEMIDSDQAWFWSKEWQKGEKAASNDIRGGRVKRFDNLEDFFKDLKK